MISLAQTMLMGIAGFMIGNMVTTRAGGESKGLDARLGPDARARPRAARHDAARPALRRARRAERRHLLPDDHADASSVIVYYFVGQVTVVSGFSGIAGINQYTPPFIGDIVNDRNRLYYIALGVAVVVYLAIRFLIRTPFGLALQGLRDEPGPDELARLRRAAAPHARVRRSPRSCAALAGRAARLVAGADRARRHRPASRRSTC